MGKITFRADDDLVDELEAFDASKSEVMREALRSYLEGHRRDPDAGVHESSARSRNDPPSDAPGGRTERASIDDLVRETVDDALERRGVDRPARSRETADVNVTITLDGVDGRVAEGTGATTRTGDADRERKTAASDAHGRAAVDGADAGRAAEADRQCGRCGESVSGEHVYCPNCGEKASRRVFCDCGDEVRSDWSFCPSCGRRTPAADVLESG